MRPSNKRSRSKQNRPRSLGNIINRVFDSSGPEGKVRGTPQQVIDKYQVLARDAQLSGDRVAAENFLQHSEHYQRMLNEAQTEMTREAEARREQQQQQGGQHRRNDDRDTEAQQDRSAERTAERSADRQGEGRQGESRQGEGRQGESRQDEGRPNDGRPNDGRMDWLGRRNRRGEGRSRGEMRSDAVIGDGDEGSMLVETPEARTEEPRTQEALARREPTQPAGDGGSGAAAEPVSPSGGAPEASEKPRAPRAARNTRRVPAAEPAAQPSETPATPDDDASASPVRAKRAPRRRKADDAAAPQTESQSPDAAE